MSLCRDAVEWFIAARPGQRKKMVPGSDEHETEKLKAQVRAKVEHSFMYIKKMFGYNKVRYRGLEKNQNRLFLLAGFTHLVRMKQRFYWRRTITSGICEYTDSRKKPDKNKPLHAAYSLCQRDILKNIK